MKIRILSLNFKKNQQYRDNSGSWKTLRPGELTLIELGSMDHYGMDVIVGVNSKKVLDTSKVKRHISMLETMDIKQRIDWFVGNFPDAKPIMLATSVINGLDGKRLAEAETSATVTGSFNLSWGN